MLKEKLNEEYIETSFYIPTEELKNKARKRRKNEFKVKQRLKEEAKHNNSLYGAYFDKNKGRVMVSHRGKNSQWLKKCSNKKIRKEKGLYNRGRYKRVFNYWCELI